MTSRKITKAFRVSEWDNEIFSRLGKIIGKDFTELMQEAQIDLLTKYKPLIDKITAEMIKEKSKKELE